MKWINEKKWMMPLIGIAALLVVGGGGVACSSPKKAPDFTLKDLSGNEISLADHKGRVVLVDFWATWCPACRYAIPDLVRMQEKYADQGLVILAVSLDDPAKANNAFLKAFKEKNRMNFPVLRGDRQVVTDFFGSGEIGLPTFFVIDRKGRLVDSHTGFAPQAIEKSVKKNL